MIIYSYQSRPAICHIHTDKLTLSASQESTRYTCSQSLRSEDPYRRAPVNIIPPPDLYFVGKIVQITALSYITAISKNSMSFTRKSTSLQARRGGRAESKTVTAYRLLPGFRFKRCRHTSPHTTYLLTTSEFTIDEINIIAAGGSPTALVGESPGHG